MQDAAGCRGRERTFRNDIKLKGRKDFFSSSSKLLSTEAFLSFSRRRSVRIVFFLSLSLSRALLRVNALTPGAPVDFVRPAAEDHRGLFSLLRPRPEALLTERQQEGSEHSSSREADRVTLCEEPLW